MEHIAGYLGTYRLLTSDALVLTMAEEPLASAEKVRAVIEAVNEVKPGMVTVPVVFRPRPVRGRRRAGGSRSSRRRRARRRGCCARYLEEQWGCRVELFSANLADRAALRADLERPEMARVDVVLTEIKAAAIDVVAEEAEARGLPVVLVDNLPVEVPPGRRGRSGGVGGGVGGVGERAVREPGVTTMTGGEDRQETGAKLSRPESFPSSWSARGTRSPSRRGCWLPR